MNLMMINFHFMNLKSCTMYEHYMFTINFAISHFKSWTSFYYLIPWELMLSTLFRWIGGVGFFRKRFTSIFDKITVPIVMALYWLWWLCMLRQLNQFSLCLLLLLLRLQHYSFGCIYMYLKWSYMCSTALQFKRTIYSWSWPKSHYNMYVAKHIFVGIDVCIVCMVFGGMSVLYVWFFVRFIVCMFEFENLFQHCWLLITSILFKIDNRAIEIFYNVWTCVWYVMIVMAPLKLIVSKTFCLLCVFRCAQYTYDKRWVTKLNIECHWDNNKKTAVDFAELVL